MHILIDPDEQKVHGMVVDQAVLVQHVITSPRQPNTVAS
jgi:hypothetical protein